MKLKFLHKSYEPKVQIFPITYPAFSPTNLVEFPEFGDVNAIAEVKKKINLKKNPELNI